MDSKRDDTELIHRWLNTHEPALREELILRYVPLVHFVLGRLGLSQGMGADYEDAASQGLLGLIEAADRFDPSFGAQFSTYATLRIRGKVIDHLRSLDWLSRGARQRARQVQDAISAFWEQYQRAPSDEELSEQLHMELPRLRQSLVDSSRMILSLDATVPGQGEEEACLHELLPDESQPEPAKALEDSELKDRLVAGLRALPERDRLILSLYYYDELTFKEIGAVLEVSESRVCQLHGRAVLSLKAHLAAVSGGHSSRLSEPETCGREPHRISSALSTQFTPRAVSG
jgi:RNA polymerase sigma factor for flagellar operon FliA